MKNPPPPPTTTPRARRRTSIGSAAAVAFADDVDSGSEKCGFVCHVLVVLLAMMGVTSRTAWAVLWLNGAPNDSSGSSNDDGSGGGSRLQEQDDHWRKSPPRGSSMMVVVPQTAIVCLFFAALVLHYVVTAWNCSRRLDALETIQDEYNNNNKTPAALLHPQPEDENSTSKNSRSEGMISDIADLDVATINDLVWEARTK